jgi:hypothetical protein
MSASPRTSVQRLAPFVVALGIVMTVTGVVGALVGGGPDDAAAPAPRATSATTVSSATAAPTAAPAPATTRPTAPPETAQAFFATFGRALAAGDSASLIARLHPLVVSRYGADQCRAYLTGLSVPRYAVEVLGVRAAEPWDWVLDGRTDRIPSAIPVRIRSTEDGTTFREVEAHVVVVDNQVRWFTDCGTPI